MLLDPTAPVFSLYCCTDVLQALLALEELIAGIDIRDDMAVLLDQALPPTLTLLRSGGDGEKVDAAILLASICEKRSGAAAFLVAEGALPAVTQLLITGKTSWDSSSRCALGLEVSPAGCTTLPLTLLVANCPLVL